MNECRIKTLRLVINEKKFTSSPNPFSLRRRGIPSFGEGQGEVILAFRSDSSIILRRKQKLPG